MAFPAMAGLNLRGVRRLFRSRKAAGPFYFAGSSVRRQNSHRVTLTLSQAVDLLRQPIEAYLDDLNAGSPDCYLQGLDLYQAGAVSGISLCPGGGEIEGVVREGASRKLHQVRLVSLSRKNPVQVLCTGLCFQLGCRHGAAFLLELLGQSDSTQTLSGPASSPGVPAIASSPSTVAGSVRLRLGVIIPPVIERMLPILEEWWQSRLQGVPISQLIQLAPKTVGSLRRRMDFSAYQYYSTPVFPPRFPPADAGEYLDYLLLKFSQDCEDLCSVFSPLMDPIRLAAVKQSWEKANLIQRWEFKLSGWEISPQPVTDPVPELRLILSHEGACLQVSSTPGSEFVRITQKNLKALERQLAANSSRGPVLSLGSEIVWQALNHKTTGHVEAFVKAMSESLSRAMVRLFRFPEWSRVHVVTPQGLPVVETDITLVWNLEEPKI